MSKYNEYNSSDLNECKPSFVYLYNLTSHLRQTIGANESILCLFTLSGVDLGASNNKSILCEIFAASVRNQENLIKITKK